MTITIRTAAEADLPAVLGLLRELNPDDPQLPDGTAQTVWKAMTAQAGRTVFIAENEGTPAGTADCLVLPNLTRSARSVMFVENVVVAGTFRRHGVGRLLLDAAAELARDSGCYKLQLLAADDDYVHTFYESCGFTVKAQGFRRYV